MNSGFDSPTTVHLFCGPSYRQSMSLIRFRWKQLSCVVHGLRSTTATIVSRQWWRARCFGSRQKQVIECLPLHGDGGWCANGHVTLHIAGKSRVFADTARRIDFKSRGRGNGFVKNGIDAGIGFATRAYGFNEAKFVDDQSVSAVSGGCFSTESMNGCQFYIVCAQAIQWQTCQCRVNEPIVVAEI